MAKLQFMDINNLGLYDELLKNYIDLADAKSLKTVALDGNVLKLYRVSEPVGTESPAYEITLPETDVSGLLAKLTGAVENNVVTVGTDGTVKDSGIKSADLALKSEVTAVDNKIGTLADLDTTAKSDLVVAINEVRNSVSAGGTEAAVSCDTSTTTEGYLKSYTLKQGSNTICTIDIPKDIFAVSGSVVTNPDADHTGTFIKLVLENQTEPLYIDVASLIENYTAQANATQVQLVVDNNTREISGTIVAGSIGTTELADASINTAKIADGNVTLAKLGTDVTPTLTQVETNKTDIADLKSKIGEGYEPIPNK